VPYRGLCIFHSDKCFYRKISEIYQDVYGSEHHDQVQIVHHRFRSFAEKINELFQLRNQDNEIVSNIGLRSSDRPIFGDPTVIKITESDHPIWVNEIKFPRLIELESQRKAIQSEIDELNEYLPILFGAGDLLEEAVIKGLRLFGLNAKRTPKAFTADIFAQTHDGKWKFGFEVTGTSGSIKKDSNKLTQLLEFERIKENDEKTILIANTHNTTPISQRKEMENFTPQVINFLGQHPILLMTSWDLYCMVRAVFEDSSLKEKFVETLYKETGVLNLKGEEWL
jgi:hypothetical protein